MYLHKPVWLSLSKILVLHMWQRCWYYMCVKDIGITCVSKILVLHVCQRCWYYMCVKDVGITCVSKMLVLHVCQRCWYYMRVKDVGIYMCVKDVGITCVWKMLVLHVSVWLFFWYICSTLHMYSLIPLYSKVLIGQLGKEKLWNESKIWKKNAWL